MPHYQSEIWLPERRDVVFAFFSDAANLEILTPPFLQFRIVTPQPIAMHPGALIDYRLKFHGFPLRWRTEIKSWDPPYKFSDEQLHGPFRRWFHTHTFTEHNGGTLCGDAVEYEVYGGALIDRWFVRPDVARIFAFREQALRLRFKRAS